MPPAALAPLTTKVEMFSARSMIASPDPARVSRVDSA